MFFDGLSGESTTAPIFDKPVYDDDIFIPGIENPTSSKFGDVFSSMSSNTVHGSAAINDFLVDSEFKSSRNRGSVKNDKVHQDFDDLIPGFRGGSSKERKSTEDSPSRPKPASQVSTENSSESVDPFEILKSNSSSGSTTNFLQKGSNLNKYGNTKSVFPEMGGVSDDTDPLNDLGKITSAYSRETIRNHEKSFSRDGPTTKSEKNPFDVDMSQKANVRNHRNPLHVQHDSNQTFFEMPPSISQPAMTGSTYEKTSYDKLNMPRNGSSPSEDFLDSLEDVWLTVSEIPLLTMSTSAPPPSRPAPSIPVQYDRESTNFIKSTQFQNSTYFSSSKNLPPKEKGSSGHHVDIDKIFVENVPNDVVERNDPFSADTEGENSAANAMKDAMDRAEAKFRHAKIARERENVKVPRNREAESFNHVTMDDVKEKVLLEKKEMLERERQKLKEMEEQERARKERAHNEAVEKDKQRQAVERATREARDRAANEARLKAERAAVEKANDEARVRAERTAVQRVQAEARERAANDAKERAEKAAEKATRERAAEARVRAERAAVERATFEARERAASEARERVASEAREKAASEAQERAAEARVRAERAAVERATFEARERAAFDARERAASEAREKAASEAREKATAAAQTMNQSQNENDLDSFFSSRSSSAPKAGSSSEFGFESQFQNRSVPETVRKSASAASSVRKASSAVNIVDDLTSIFGTAPSSSFEFQEIGGESEERRMARLERHQKTQERAAKALAEKNERDLQNQRDQAERHRIAETLDVEIKRWAAGKETNLRALLSTLQYVLWPDCGWQPLSLTDLINASSVKKAYRRATLCIHPDKVQQKGANLQQKYIAEKVFDLLKEAWNRFNSEELF